MSFLIIDQVDPPALDIVLPLILVEAEPVIHPHRETHSLIASKAIPYALRYQEKHLQYKIVPSSIHRPHKYRKFRENFIVETKPIRRCHGEHTTYSRLTRLEDVPENTNPT